MRDSEKKILEALRKSEGEEKILFRSAEVFAGLIKMVVQRLVERGNGEVICSDEVYEDFIKGISESGILLDQLSFLFGVMDVKESRVAILADEFTRLKEAEAKVEIDHVVNEVLGLNEPKNDFES